MRMSSLFLRTLREDPAEAEVPSQRLLVRAGYIRRVAPGSHTWLPLGKRVLDRVAAVVRSELASIGAQEVQLPTLVPRGPYETSGRFAKAGDDAFLLTDRRGAELLLASEHDELAALLVKNVCSSYRDYPIILYEARTVFRNEPRPRGGLLREREYLAADSYSFDLSDEGCAASYRAHHEAFTRIFERLGLAPVVAHAKLGGEVSEIFLVQSPVGESTFARCSSCAYTASIEAVTTPPPEPRDPSAWPPMTVHDTPNTPTIETLVELANAEKLGGRADWTAADTLKNVVLEVTCPGAEPYLLVVGVPGDREVDLRRVEAALRPATVSLFDDFASRPDLVRGYIGPQVLPDLGIRYLVDPRVAAGSSWLTGANAPGRHATNVVAGRDFTPDGTIEAADVRDGDPCPACRDGALSVVCGIKVGHTTKLGDRFADAVGLEALGPDGKPVRVAMGSYHLAISRVVAAIAEQHHDDQGLAWPASVAPADVHIVAVGKGDQLAAAARLAEELAAAGKDVILDDRTEVSAGVKFTDAELIGVPVTVVVGRRIAEGLVELRRRAANTREEVALATLAGKL